MIKKKLNHQLLIYIGLVSILFITLYSLIIANYFLFGLELSSKVILDNEARIYATAYKGDVNTATPSSTFLKSYRSKEDIPQSLLQLFSEDEDAHREIKVAYIEENMTNEAFLNSNNICQDKVCDTIFLYNYNLQGDEWLYLIMGIPDLDNDEQQKTDFDNALIVLLSIAFIFFATIMVLTYLLVKNIGQPIALLARWADDLNLNNLNEETPNLKFKELDVVATHLKSAFVRINKLLNNEKEFLNSASHELRTPIAVLSTNLSLLEALRESADKESQETQVINRLFRSVENMKQLTQTLLWLSKDTDDFPKSTLVSIDNEIPQIIAENRYLIEHKSVEVTFQSATCNIFVPKVLCKIVLTNLIRNAFQYTHEGHVNISIESFQIEVSNSCESQIGLLSEEVDYGFGLGLELVRRISYKLHWQFHSEDIKGGRVVNLTFPNDK